MVGRRQSAYRRSRAVSMQFSQGSAPAASMTLPASHPWNSLRNKKLTPPCYFRKFSISADISSVFILYNWSVIGTPIFQSYMFERSLKDRNDDNYTRHFLLDSINLIYLKQPNSASTNVSHSPVLLSNLPRGRKSLTSGSAYRNFHSSRVRGRAFVFNNASAAALSLTFRTAGRASGESVH